MAWRWREAGLVGAALVMLLSSGSDPLKSGPLRSVATGTEHLRVEVLDRYPHDPDAFTQGLELRDDRLYESTGLRGSSDVRYSDPRTGEVRRRVELAPLPDGRQPFGEGLTLVDDARLIQLTWQENIAYVRDLESLEELDRLEYSGEGWGLCHDGDRLIMTDGGSRLTFRDPDTFAAIGTVEVELDGRPVAELNELECVDGAVWANVWRTDRIVRIDPSTGTVEAVVDASGLLTDAEAGAADVLNGIAAIPSRPGVFLITGKHWPWVFEVRFVPARVPASGSTTR